MQNFIASPYIQAAVVISALTTLIVLIFQGTRYLIIPTYRALEVGVARYVAGASSRRESILSRCLSDQRFFQLTALRHIIAVMIAIFNVILCGILSIVLQFSYIPNYQTNLATYTGIDKDSTTILSVIMATLSVIFFMLSLLNCLRFIQGMTKRLSPVEKGD
jgi:hypothetical protein